jgi:uncharacterized protein (UPF0303 family)
MSEAKVTLDEVIGHEKELVWSSFTNEMALELGNQLIELGRERSASITIDIMRHGHQLFHYSFSGTSPDNDQWVKRKTRVVNRFNKSSLRVGLELAEQQRTIEERYFVDAFEYSPHGGSVPITISNVGVVGTVTVSGLTQQEDHMLVVEAMRSVLR